MRVNDAIARANELRPNALDDVMKARWLRELDGQFLSLREETDAEPPVIEPEEWPRSMTWPEVNAELLIPFPHELVYVYYLCAMIDYEQMELELYANDMTRYNTALTEANAWWRREHAARRSGKNWRTM